MNHEDLLTTREVAAYLRIGEQTVRDMLARKDLPGIKFGKVWRIPRADLEAMTQIDKPAKKKKT
jgi:excisionase family DNA binding protein